MLRQKAFTRVSKSGGVNKVIQEHYLREDIPCGVQDCIECTPLMMELGKETAFLDPNHSGHISTVVGGPHFILPDTNILLHHLDILETPFFQDVIILQTVLEEVKSNKPGIYQRVRSLVTQNSKRFFVFSNEVKRQTFIEKKDNESSNDRNDRAIRVAASWYGGHLSIKEQPLQIKNIRVVLITNDSENRRLAKEMGLLAFSLQEYCKGLLDFKGADAVMDMLESAKDAVDNEALEYSEYLGEEHLESGLKSGKYYKGTMQVSPYNRNNGTITCDTMTIKVTGVLNMNRSLQGDVVYVELLPRDQWQNGTEAAEEIDEEQESSRLTVPATEEELVTLPAVESTPMQESLQSQAVPYGKVVGIKSRNVRAYCGSIDRKTIKESAGNLPQFVLVALMDRRFPKIRLRTRNAIDLKNQRIMIRIDGWEKSSRYPHGHFVKSLGVAGESQTETNVILLEHDISADDFTPQVMACLPSPDWKPSENDYVTRQDFRDLTICSVDPPGCTDIDDALHAVRLSNGNFEVGVHIADVTHFVKANTPLDLEASKRSTTVYLVDRRIDMLPGLLGTNLCSLKCNVERFAFSCIWELNPEAEILSTKFCKSIIKSKASFTYDEAQSRLEDPNSNDALSSSLKILNDLARKLRSRRVQAGALTLASPEVRFSLDTETQNPVDVILKEMKDANSMVEEFMLLANISVAQKCYLSFPDTAVLRRHPSPPAENFAALNKALQERNFSLDFESSKALAESLDRIVIPDDPFFNRLVRIMTTRCMYQAQYFASGSISYDAFWHYGLATPIYTHFTSPIRRYADVLVHRLLAASVYPESHSGSSIGWNKQQLEDVCTNMNFRHRMAQQAQRSSIELFTHLFFKNKTVIEDAYIIKIMSNGIVTLIPKYGIEGLIKWTDQEMETCKLEFNPESSRFTNNTGDTILSLFQKVQISLKVEEIESSQRQKLTITLVQPTFTTPPSSPVSCVGQKRQMDID